LAPLHPPLRVQFKVAPQTPRAQKIAMRMSKWGPLGRVTALRKVKKLLIGPYDITEGVMCINKNAGYACC